MFKKIWNFIKRIPYYSIKVSQWVVETCKRLFTKRFKVTVSFNSVYGDSDDRVFITRKVLIQKEKHLKFRDDHGKIVEYRSSGGLNYIIEEYDG
jgi:hypothetical protein